MQTLDRKLSVLEAGTSQAAFSVESDLADIEDLLSYANDVLNTGMIDCIVRVHRLDRLLPLRLVVQRRSIYTLIQENRSRQHVFPCT